MRYNTLDEAIKATGQILYEHGEVIKTEKWQGIDLDDKPHMEMLEYYDWNFKAPITPIASELVRQTQPNLPWAEDHFLERVGGEPLNPGEEYKNWPYFVRDKANDRHRDEEGQHSHTYMERFWTPQLHGLRYSYGNLDDVVKLLAREPLTRQAYLPIWFPEDTGVKFMGRVPCSLGYHFMVRGGKLHIFYPMRSCDYFRHFRDDVYMAARMVYWVLGELRAMERRNNPEKSLKELYWFQIAPGDLSMHILSLHVFSQEKRLLKKEFSK